MTGLLSPRFRPFLWSLATAGVSFFFTDTGWSHADY